MTIIDAKSAHNKATEVNNNKIGAFSNFIESHRSNIEKAITNAADQGLYTVTYNFTSEGMDKVDKNYAADAFKEYWEASDRGFKAEVKAGINYGSGVFNYTLVLNWEEVDKEGE